MYYLVHLAQQGKLIALSAFQFSTYLFHGIIESQVELFLLHHITTSPLPGSDCSQTFTMSS